MRSTFSHPLWGAAQRAIALASLSAALGLPVALHAQDQTPPPNSGTTTPAPDAGTPAPAPEANAPAPAPTPETTPTVPVTPAVPEKAAAPETKDKDATSLEAIEVTGSRLKRTDYESAQPVVSISREDIERTGLTDISQILRQLTIAGNNSLTTSQARFSISLGETNLDLRNLGAQHTLLLVNGRRWVTGLVPTQPSVSDFNTIPTSIIERVEVLKDGASAIYGSDAIGGVVNIITRKDFEGFGVDYQLGNYIQQGDGTNQQASISWGRNQPGSSLFMNLSYTNQATAPIENRNFTASPNMGIARDSVVTPRGTFTLVNPTSANAGAYNCPNLQGGIAAGAAGGVNPALGPAARMTSTAPVGLVECTLERNVNASPTSSTMGDYHQRVPTDPNDTFNRYADGTLTEPSTRYALYTQFNKDLFEHVSFNLDGLYNHRKSTSVGQNGYLAGGNLSPGGHGYLAFIGMNDAGNPFGQDIGRDSSCGGNPNSPSCTGLGTGSGIWRIRRPQGENNFNNYDSVDTVRLGSGLRGDLELMGQAFFWDGGYIFARNHIEDVSATYRYDRIAAALGHDLSGNAVACVSPCVPLDVFHGATGLTRAAVNYVAYGAVQRNQSRQDIGYLDLSTDLPSFSWLPGPIAMATGAEFRRDRYGSVNDPLLQQNLLFFLNKQVDTAGQTFAREGYLELGIPVLKDLPFANVVDLDIAGRYSEYPHFGSVVTYKGGLRWKPIDDLLVRGTYSTGFRAPNVAELYLSPSVSYDPLTDPCANATDPTTVQNCTADGAQNGGSQGNVATPYDLWQGNLNLRPEKSKNLTYGLVYSPHWLPDFNVSVDFYDIEVSNYITIGLGQYFLNNCYTTPRSTGAAGPDCQYIHRDSTGSLTFIDTPYFNYAKIKTSGVDGGVDYLLPLPAQFGHFKVMLDASYLARYDQYAPQPGQPDQLTGLVGTDTQQFSGFPRWKAGTALTWKRDLYSASWSTRMAYQMTEPCNDVFGANDPTVAPSALGLCSNPQFDAKGNDISTNVMKTVFYHNVQVGREVPSLNADITFGVNNVLDQNPAYSRSNIALYWYNYDPNQYEVPGRFAYLRTSFKF